ARSSRGYTSRARYSTSTAGSAATTSSPPGAPAGWRAGDSNGFACPLPFPLLFVGTFPLPSPPPLGLLPLERFLFPAMCAALSPAAFARELPKPMVTGLVNPESVCVGPGGRIFVTTIGEFDKDGDGAVMVIENGKAVPFVTGLDDPKGMAVFQKWLFVADK